MIQQKPILEKVPLSQSQSFAVKEEILPYIKIGWHVHPEYELTLFTESSGRMFIGDHTSHFGPGTLLLLGPHLPHYMRNDEIYYQGHQHLRLRAIVVHFAGDFLGEKFFDVPETTGIKALLERSARGLLIAPRITEQLGGQMEQLLLADKPKRLFCLLDILQQLSVADGHQSLASLGYQPGSRQHDAERINRAFAYLLQHYRGEISLEEIAEHIHMSKPSFCKFFKSRTGKTFTRVLNEIRVGHACKLMQAQDMPVSEVAYRCGYSSVSYFNRRFRQITGYAPQAYRKQFVAG